LKLGLVIPHKAIAKVVEQVKIALYPSEKQIVAADLCEAK
jgi:hypothetical protein